MLGLKRLGQRLSLTNLGSSQSIESSLIKIAAPIISTSLVASPANSLSRRNISSSIIDSPGRRIIGYFEKYPELTDRCQFMITQLESTLSDTELYEFRKNLDHNIIADPREHLKALLTTCAILKFGKPETRWENYPIEDIEAIPGIGHRYSTSSFIEILKYLPDIIIDQHGKKPISFTELGGFAFNDSFLLARDFEKCGLRASRFTGVDIHHQGNIAATVFNEKVAKIKNYYIIKQDILKYTETLKTEKNSNESCHVAIRFLAVFDPAFINLFFRRISASLKDKDVFVFNYSVFNDQAKRVGALKKHGYELQEKGGMHMLFHNNTHIQTFLTEDKVQEILKENNFERIASREEEILGRKGTVQVRGQKDSYSRTTEFVVKKSPIKN